MFVENTVRQLEMNRVELGLWDGEPEHNTAAARLQSTRDDVNAKMR